MLAVKKVKMGNNVAFNLKFGKLSLSQGSISFNSEVLANLSTVAPSSVRQYPISHSHMGVRRQTVDEISYVSRNSSQLGTKKVSM